VGKQESDTLNTPLVIHWIARAPDLYEARVVLPNGRDVYAGYVAVTPGAAVWRGYVGRGFIPLGTGPRAVMQAAVEQRVADIMQRASAQEGTGLS